MEKYISKKGVSGIQWFPKRWTCACAFARTDMVEFNKLVMGTGEKERERGVVVVVVNWRI